jgi:hypothetical protein
VKRLLPVLALLVALVPGTAPAQAAEPTEGQTTFTAIEPVRVLDTRQGAGLKVGPGGVVDVLVGDRAPGATSVVLTVTATAASAATDVRAYPTPAAGGGVPQVSNLNLGPGQTVANLVHVTVGDGGRVRLRNASGSVHLLADLSGFHAPGDGATFVPAVPRRLLDTRQTGGPLGAGQVRDLQVRGAAAGAPAGASAVVLNVTAVGATAPTDVRVWPKRAGAPPRVSNLNPVPGRETPVAVVVGVGDADRVSLRNAAGSVQLVVDLAGWYVGGTDGAVFHGVAPVRLLNTREQTPVAAGESRPLVVAGAGVVPPTAQAVVLNVTALGATAGTNVRAYPKGAAVPGTSNLNLAPGQTVANQVVARVGQDGQVLLRNAAGSTQLVVDLAGWFGPSGDGWDISWPQCTTAGSTISRLPDGGAFAVVGVNRGVPFTANECFEAQWDWASSLPGEPAVYLNTNAPGAGDGPDRRVWTEVCGTGTPTGDCAFQYGVRLAQYALDRIPDTPEGGKPYVWLDVEDGPVWQAGYAGAVAVNRGVINGAAATLRAAGYRYGIYTDRSDSTSNDWRNIMGNWVLDQLQNWVFRVADGETAGEMCGKDVGSTGGPAVMVQQQPEQSGQEFDVNHTC